jgi:Replication regulatory protein RepB
MLKLAPVSRLSEDVEQIKIFLKSEERELVKQVCKDEGISMTHLARQLLVAWASQQQQEKSA